MIVSRRLGSLFRGALCVWLLPGCGGSVSQIGGSAGSNTGADSSGANGSAAGSSGTPGLGGAGSANRAGAGNEPGGPCRLGNESYMPGQSFLASDGCNQCSCGQDGTVTCTQTACVNQCEIAQTEYEAALDRLKTCTPGKPNQCTSTVADTLRCGCSVPINPDQKEILTALVSAQARVALLHCRSAFCGGDCGPPTEGYCAPEGRCQYLASTPGKTACKVAGVIYPSGTSDIPDPASCNKCSCEDGRLACTEIHCPIECPPNSVSGSQCAACGPTDRCQVVEYGCLPVCTDDTCPGGACIDGVCRTVCG